MKNVVQDLTSAGLDWAREKWRGSVASKFIRGGEKNAVKYADEIIVLSKGVQKYFMDTYGRETHFIPNGVNKNYWDCASDTIKPRLERCGADCRKVAFINEETYSGLTLDDERILNGEISSCSR